MHAFARSISAIWLVTTPLSGLALILIVFIRAYSLQRRTVIREDAEKTNDPEGGESPGEAGSTEVEEVPRTKGDATERTPSSLEGETARQKTEA